MDPNRCQICKWNEMIGLMVLKLYMKAKNNEMNVWNMLPPWTGAQLNTQPSDRQSRTLPRDQGERRNMRQAEPELMMAQITDDCVPLDLNWNRIRGWWQLYYQHTFKTLICWRDCTNIFKRQIFYVAYKDELVQLRHKSIAAAWGYVPFVQTDRFVV